MQRKWQVLIVTAVAVFMSFLDVTIVNIAFPDIRDDFAGSSLASLSWILNAYNIVFAALLVPAGRLADRVGRRAALLRRPVDLRRRVGGLWPGAERRGPRRPRASSRRRARRCSSPPRSRCCCPSSRSSSGRPPRRSGAPPAPSRRRPARRSAACSSRRPAGGSSSSSTCSFAVAALVPARRLLRPDGERGTGPLPDVVGVGLLVAGVGLLVAGDRQGRGLGLGLGGACSARWPAAVALLALCALRSSRHPAPVVELSLFRVRSFAVATGGVALFALGFYALLLGNVLFLTQVWGWSVLTAGFALTPGPLTAAVFAPRRRAPVGPLRPARRRAAGRAAVRDGLPRVRLARRAPSRRTCVSSCPPRCSPAPGWG